MDDMQEMTRHTLRQEEATRRDTSCFFVQGASLALAAIGRKVNK